MKENQSDSLPDENLQMGWVCLHRAIEKHWIWDDCSLLGAWIKIITEVNHAPKKVQIKGRLLKVARGQSVKSLDSWVNIMGKGWTKDKLRTFIKLLKSDHMITTENLGVTIRLTVTNYDKYQNIPTQIPHRSHADPTQIPPNNNDNNENNINNKKRFKKPTADEITEYAKSWGYDLDGQAFIDFYESKGWMVGGNKMTNWKNCVNTWRHREKKHEKTNDRRSKRLNGQYKEENRAKYTKRIG